MNIEEYLNKGRANAITCRQLAALLCVHPRLISKWISEARRRGVLICASCSGPDRGYYLAQTREEAAEYIEGLKSRAIEIFKTRQAIKKQLDALPLDLNGPGDENANVVIDELIEE